MKNKLKLLLGMALFISGASNAQVGIGTTEPKGALDITSTSGGLLVPRMTTTDRNGVTPQNAMLIFNTTNNSFEVYKTACSCWVTVYDGGTTPASSLVNTAPTANNVSVSGQYLVGKTLTLNYTYFDGQQDPEGLTTFQWQISGTSNGADFTNIVGANAATYIPVTENVGNFIRATVIPRATTGVKNGIITTTGWTLIEAATSPTANNLLVLGTPAQGSTLTASYTFAGGTGIEDVSITGTQYVWQVASDDLGNNSYNASTYDASAYTNEYTPQTDLLGKFIRVTVRTKDSGGLQSSYVNSPWVGPITTAVEAGPVASNVTYSPAPAVNLTLTGTYSYSDINNDPEGTSTYQWYLADDASGLNQTEIAGATSATYLVTPSAGNKYVGFRVTPNALSGTLTGFSSAVYYNTTPTAPVATFTFTGSTHRQLPFFCVNKLMNSQENSIQVEVDVTSAGGLVVTSTTENGYSFAGNFTLATGTQWITLSPTGTQVAYSSIGDIFTITGEGNSTETKSITIKHTKKGADFTTHYNGWVGGSNATPNAVTYSVGETFNNYSGCATKLISTSACPAGNTVTGASGTVYPTVSINGQCWMQKNLKEVPSNFASISPTTFTPNVDYGGWGYYNTTTTSGGAGFATTEQVADYGLLYQWSAAMNGATNERAQGACPTGWHVPSECEWRYLEHGVGQSLVLQDAQFWGRNATNLSNKLRSQGYGQNNSSGFSLLFAGARQTTGTGEFVEAGSPGSFYIFTSTNLGSSKRYLRSTDVVTSIAGAIALGDYPQVIACSVRCLKD